MIDFRLQVFYAVAKGLNFTKASAELFISQPAVTKHIKELEQEFKMSLFERSGNKKSASPQPANYCCITQNRFLELTGNWNMI